ncbi:CvpA family protein [Duodenibacillus massiliensis]|uniref:CvpA family protein n=1 Tax=Duodenibacillus massiliensis TaxID=1852381 RepID=UPI0023A8900D|nr:CvpA family protein [Duodenibacillus massiliensis]
MNEADFVICAVLLVSTVVGVSRGVVREILAIVGWAVAIFLALNYSPELARVIPLESLGMAVRTACAAVIIVVLTLFTCGLFGKICSRLLEAAEITFEDRAIGSVFGFARGVVVVCLAVFLLGMTSAVRTGQWRNSVLIVPCERIIDFTMPYMPETIVEMRKRYSVR